MANEAAYRAVNRTCGYRNASGKLRPAIMTAVGAGTNVDLKGLHTGETFAAVPLWSRSAPTTPGWRPNAG